MSIANGFGLSDVQQGRSNMVRDIVIGMSDGLIVPFALAAGLSAVTHSTAIIVNAGIAVIAIGSIAMGLGGYLIGKSEQHYYLDELNKETSEDEQLKSVAVAAKKDFFAGLGLNEKIQDAATKEMVDDKQQWVDFMMKYELGLNPNRARNSAFNIGLSYVAGGIIPILPYLFLHNVQTACMVSVGITLTCLFIFGYFKNSILGMNRWAGACMMLFTGALAAVAVFSVAKVLA